MSGLVVVGMHRSGTSLTAQMLAAGGWHPGADLLTSDREEYFEDSSFVALHRRWTADDLAGLEPSSSVDTHADWGVIDARVAPVIGRRVEPIGDRVREANDYAAMREHLHGTWVAKDPRATLHVDVWSRVRDLRFVVVYRNPWDVVDSAVRLGSEVFCRRPGIARQAWLGYHLRLLRFIRDHRERVTVIAAEAAARTPERVWEHLDLRVGMVGRPSSTVVDPHRFVLRDDTHAIAALYREVYPVHSSVLTALDQVADVPRSAPPRKATRSWVVPGGSLPAGTGVQVIVPCRDDGDYLVEAISSVEQAATSPVELTIVDDGSSHPETLRVLEALRAMGRQVLRTDGVGLPAARHAGCVVSRTGIVLPLDADNRLRPAMLEAARRMPALGVDIVHGPWNRFGMDDRVVHPPHFSLDNLVPHNQIDACALISRGLLERLGGWDEHLPFWEDWDLWLRAACAGARTHRVDEVLFDYLVRPGALSQRHAHHAAVAAAVLDRMMSKDRRIRQCFEQSRLDASGEPA